MSSRPLVIGSRGSRLALLQAEWVRDRLCEAQAGLEVTIAVIETKADKMLDSPLAKIGDKGLFIKELEQALMDGRIDLAVHSAKDVPTELPQGLALGAFTEREQVHDVYVGTASSLADIPEITEFNIGHSIIANAIFIGLDRSVREMLAAIRSA